MFAYSWEIIIPRLGVGDTILEFPDGRSIGPGAHGVPERITGDFNTQGPSYTVELPDGGKVVFGAGFYVATPYTEFPCNCRRWL